MVFLKLKNYQMSFSIPLLSNPRYLSFAFGYEHNPIEIKIREKNQVFWLWKNTYHSIFIYGEVGYHRNFTHFSVGMELYGRKFFILVLFHS